MNVQIKHNSTTITGFVISYEREHRICTGIGTLDIVLDGTIPRSFDPWDTIDIHENGDFKVRYYVSEIRHSVPDGTITLECQDKSKQLVDYFIPDAYTIDYPSHTRYWIEKFFTEAGITYQFQTTSQGPLLSNYTALGLAPAYDQIMMLLQLSGWYFYFDGKGKAIIGPLSTDLAVTSATLNKDDILNISRVTDDKMLRNRAVVWGAFDPLLQQYAFADISTHTGWNYDRRDLRTMVISNSNIPNKSSAVGIANILLKEFAKATIEKHLVAWGARDFDLGDAVRVNSDVWRGKGLVTTFGVSLSKEGLVTNVILDERCPRLLGFFNFGDYVYVGTFGDGVWRKHIQFDPTFYNFSTGLTDLNITDLHINQGVFGAIGHSGAMYYANSEDGPWHSVTVTGLMSSSESLVTSSGLVADENFSGIMGRAVIIDRQTNTVKYGVDNWSGLNYGDYFLSYSGWVGSASGVSISGDHRGWILEYDPVNGQLVGGLGSGIYPISVSGNYNLTVLDLENDGINDYVSVRTVGSGIPQTGDLYNYGRHYTQPFASTFDDDAYSIHGIDPEFQTNNQLASASNNLATVNPNALIAIDNHINGYRRVIAVGKDTRVRKLTYTRSFNVGSDSWQISVATTTSATQAVFTSKVILGIYPFDLQADEYDIFYTDNSLAGNATFSCIRWNATANTFGSATLIGTEGGLDTPNGIDIINSLDSSLNANQSVVINDIIYCIRFYVSAPTAVAGNYKSASEFHIYLLKVNMATRTFSQSHMLELVTSDYNSDTNYAFIPSNGHTTSEVTSWQRNWVSIFQNEGHPQIIGYVEEYEKEVPTRSIERGIVGDETLLQTANLYDGSSFRFGSGSVNTGCQLTKNSGFIGRIGSSGADGFAFNGTNFAFVSGSTNPYYFEPSKIYPIFSATQDVYIAKDTIFFNKCSAQLGGSLLTISPPNHTLVKPFSNATGPFGHQIFWRATNLVDFGFTLLPWDFTDFQYDQEIRPNNIPTGITKGINFGNFFISNASDYTVTTPQAAVLYIDLGAPDYDVGTFLILQREGTDFNIIQQAGKPLRVDISNSSPVLSVQDFENTFVSNFVFGQELTQIIPISGLLATREVRDYRYTMLETAASGIIVASGTDNGITKQIIYVNQSGVFTADADSYSGGFALMGIAPSGERIETTNYTYPGQYIFIASSGLNPAFYQQDAGSLVFDTYSGLPDSRVTIIRADDRL